MKWCWLLLFAARFLSQSCLGSLFPRRGPGRGGGGGGGVYQPRPTTARFKTPRPYAQIKKINRNIKNQGAAKMGHTFIPTNLYAGAWVRRPTLQARTRPLHPPNIPFLRFLPSPGFWTLYVSKHNKFSVFVKNWGINAGTKWACRPGGKATNIFS